MNVLLLRSFVFYGHLAPPALTMLSLEAVCGKRNADDAGGDDDERLDASRTREEPEGQRQG